MAFRRNLAGLLFFLLAITGSAHAAPSRLRDATPYVYIVQSADEQIQEERQTFDGQTEQLDAPLLTRTHISLSRENTAGPRAPPVSLP